MRALFSFHTFSGCDSANLQIEHHLFDTIESIVFQAYGFLNKPNDVRYENCCVEKFSEPSKIPLKKTSYINMLNASTTKHLEAYQEIPDADQHGWGVIDGTCKDHWMDNQTDPDEILELVAGI